MQTGSLGCLWRAGMQVVQEVAALVTRLLEGSTAAVTATLAVNMAQQLLQTGG
jgi:hypothetical protein